jgi:transposase
LLRGVMTDAEWAVFEPVLVHRGSTGGRPPQDHRRVLDGVFWIARTGAPWRDLPTEFGNWNSVWRQFRRWCLSGVWDLLLEAAAESGGELDALQMIDSTTVRAHRCAAGAKGGLRIRRSAARGVGSPPKSTCGAMPSACRSLST